ncbi:uncharacterized mitochondrial protein AtMg00810-like [Capsicum annuum]|uniref:uncharacterized mitochondrial protein AtMg00810-like n=1 Tax=Capsicum annuum TaxID=4072 RepID=UPI001FB08246|nr:uncharacterized mitochondrial protein AtMg00810-like [Capsicum annuum]
MKDLGELRHFLGIEFARSQQSIVMHQRKYALKLISKTGPSAAKQAPTPMDATTRLTTSEYDQHIKKTDQDCDMLADQGAYQRLIGKLLYLTITKPDIAYSVQTLSQFLQKPKQSHMNVALRIVKYIKGKPGQGLLLSSNKRDVLIAHYDVDWVACAFFRKSITGYTIKFATTRVASTTTIFAATVTVIVATTFISYYVTAIIKVVAATSILT